MSRANAGPRLVVFSPAATEPENDAAPSSNENSGTFSIRSPKCLGRVRSSRRVQQRCSIERALNVLAPGDDLVLETDTAVVDLADSEE